MGSGIAIKRVPPESYRGQTKTFVVTFPDKTKESVGNVYTYWIDTELKILYFKDGNGEIIAVFREWWGFTLKRENG
jgi:hypothetical protein